MKNIVFKLLIVSYVLIVASAASAQQVKTEISIFLNYTPRSENTVSIKNDALNKPVIIEPFKDARGGSDMSVIGQNTENSFIIIRSRNSVADFATQVFKSCFTKWGGQTSLDAKMHLQAEILKFYVSETNLYRSDVIVRFSLINESGVRVWQKNARGNAKVFGRSLKQENYNEAFSDALQDAYESALTDLDLWTSWDKKVVPQGTFKVDELKEKVLNLKKEGMSEQVMVEFVSQRPLESAMTAEQAIDWKNAGISQLVIAALMKAGAQTGDSK